MSDDNTQVQDTQHAFLVAWGWFAAGLHSRRRTDLLNQRIEAFERRIETTRQRWQSQQEAIRQARHRVAERGVQSAAAHRVLPGQRHVETADPGHLPALTLKHHRCTAR